MDKKGFAKVVTKIRRQLGTKEYPKAMMTSAQIANRTATINCTVYSSTGYRGPDSMEMAKEIKAHPLLLAFLAAEGAVAAIEPISGSAGHYQVRLRWKQDIVGLITETVAEMEGTR